MAWFDDWTTDDGRRGLSHRLEPQQLRAVAAPDLPLSELAEVQPLSSSAGNFDDLEELIEQLGAAPLFELGKPLPNPKFLPRAGTCPATHNRALLDTDGN
jgi:hypothetical protein